MYDCWVCLRGFSLIIAQLKAEIGWGKWLERSPKLRCSGRNCNEMWTSSLTILGEYD